VHVFLNSSNINDDLVNSITLGDGNNDTVYGGGFDTITLGNGNNDTVFSGGLFSRITVGNGNDTIHVGQNDTVTVGKGQDSFVFDAPSQNGQFGIEHVTINGFDPSKDVIKLQSFFFNGLQTPADDGHGNTRHVL
jgi:hypothetical protein